jgi:hypothetical protein
MAIDRKSVEHIVKETLKHGTPRWVSNPQEYRGMANEWHAQVREDLLAECRAYKFADQDLLSNPKGRRVNLMAAAVFMRKLRSAGITCFSHDSQLNDGSASLFVLMPTATGGEFQPMSSIQVPLMWEWSTIRLDPRTNLPAGFRDIGWRSAVRCLITNGVLTEDQAHVIFGKSRESSVSRIYRRMLCEHRNGGKRYA